MSFKNNTMPFFKHLVASALLLAGFALPAQAIDIVWSGTQLGDEQALISFIEGNFSDVTINYGDFSDYATNAAVIEAADLFILGRQLSSNAYDNGTNSASFNALTVPVVAFTSYVTRPTGTNGGRWGWHDGDVAAGLSVVGNETAVTAAGAAVFGVAAGDYDWFPEPDTFNAAGSGAVGDGEILATMGGNILSAHWNAGDLSGTGATFGSERLLFNFNEVGSVTTLPNAAGQQALISALEAFTPLTAVSDLWNVNGGGSFNVAGNWSENAVPTQNPVFGSVLTSANAPATVTLDSPVSLNSVSFQNPNQYILAGPETLTLTGAREVAVGSGAHQITANIAGTAGIVKTGPGTLILSDAKGYTGATDVQAGVLLLNNLDAIDNQASGVLNVGAAGTINLGTGATGTLAAELTGTGAVALLAELAPTDTVTISRSNASYDGLVRVVNGTLAVTHSNALGSGALTVNRTALDSTTGVSTGKVALSGGVTIANEFLDIDGRSTDAVALTSSGNNAWNGVIQGQAGSADFPLINIESTSETLTLNQLYAGDGANPQRFVFSGAGNTTITGRLSDANINVDTGVVTVKANDNVEVIKRGSGTLTIGYATTAENDYWFGPTVIEEGTLAVNESGGTDGELRSSDITIKSGATLNVSAFTEYTQQIGQALRGSGSVAVGAGHNLRLIDVSTVAPGDDVGAVGELTVVSGNVTLPDLGLGGGGEWSFDVGNNTNTSSDRLNVAAGSFTASSAGITVNVTPVHGHLDAGARTIVSHTGGANSVLNGATGQITDVNGNPLNTRQTVAINGNTAGQVNVVVTGEEASRTWNGNVSGGAWDVATTSNWQEDDQQYQDLDHVTFDDSASGTTDVTVDGSRFAGSVTFANSTMDYTLSGDGGIIGTGTVNVTGTGQVTLANTGNNFSGATSIASGGSLRMTSANTGGITNAGTLSLGVPIMVEAFAQNGTQSIGTNNHKVFAIEAEDYVSRTVNNAGVVVWDEPPLTDANASGGEALIATPAGNNNLDTNLAAQNYVNYGMKFTEPGEYFVYARYRGEDSGDGSTADDDSFLLPATDFENGVTAPQSFSTKFDGDQLSSARNAEGGDSNGQLFDFDWYISSGQTGGFDRIVVTPADVANGTVFQFGVATRESGAVLDKFVFVQDPDFVADAAFGTITDLDLDGVAPITTTSTETTTSMGNILNVASDFTMSGNGSVLNVLVGTADIHDQINISGNLVADGILNVQSLSGSVVAEIGDVFDVFNFASASGAFDDIALPLLAGGLHWDTSNLLVTGELLVASSGLLGDYNSNGIVDAADYTVWRNILGQNIALLNENPDAATPGVVDQEDYDFWKSQYGNSIGSGSGGLAGPTVPEPASFALLALAAVAAFPTIRRRT